MLTYVLQSPPSHVQYTPSFVKVGILLLPGREYKLSKARCCNMASITSLIPSLCISRMGRGQGPGGRGQGAGGRALS